MSRFAERTSGVLMHPTSLPGGPIGTLGGDADAWIAWLREAGQGLWQVLPLVAVDEGGSPYNGLSAMAGNTMLLDPGRLREDGWLADLPANPDSSSVDFGRAAALSDALVRSAQESLSDRPADRGRTGPAGSCDGW